jgi:hypothetical protein
MMTLFMGIATMSIAQGGVTTEIVSYAIKTEIFFFVFAFLMETIVIENVVMRFARNLISPKDSKNAKIIVFSTFTVIFMSAFMVMFGGVFLNGFSMAAIEMFKSDWPLYFMIALAWQWIVAGPVGRKLLNAIFSKSREAQMA